MLPEDEAIIGDGTRVELAPKHNVTLCTGSKPLVVTLHKNVAM